MRMKDQLKDILSGFERSFYQRLIYGGTNTATTSSAWTEQEPLTLEKLKAVVNDIPPPPPVVRYSKHATAFPSAKPKTYDMQMLVERLGRQRVPAAFKMIDYQGAPVVVAHPDFKTKKGQEA